jgi:hypothetical protein
MSPIQQMLLGIPSGSKPKYIDEVFSTYLYDGNQTPRTITNNIDLSKGGLVWTKRRSGSGNHMWYDTVRGATYYVKSNQDNAEGNDANTLTSFNSDGFSLGNDTGSNDSGEFVSWSLRTRENFFDIVEYTGTGSVQNISHNLKSVPGCIMIKKTNGVEDWNMYHRSLGNTKYIKFNKNQGVNTATSRWNDTTPTSSVFTVGTAGDVNASGDTYIAYLFAHHDGTGDFGESEDKDVIYCGSYTSTTLAITENSIGWEPQWLMLKNSYGRNANWAMLDTMRGQSAAEPEDHLVLNANENNAEQDVNESGSPVPISKGFKLASGSYAEYNFSSDEIIYIAFRMPDGVVGKPPEVGSDVFNLTNIADTSFPMFASNFKTDFVFYTDPTTTSWQGDRYAGARKLGTGYMKLNTTGANASGSWQHWDYNTGEGHGANGYTNFDGYLWKRGKGFDVLIQSMTGSSYQFWNHTCMGQAPEMCWMKKMDGAADWEVWHKDLNGGTASYNWSVHLNEYEPEYQPGGGVNYMWGLANPPDASSVIVLDSYFGGAGDYMMLLFSSVTGISKVGSYSGSSSQQTISTGFQPRFVILRRIDTQQDWVQLDTLRGWAQGVNDPRIELNNDTAQNSNTDFGYPTTGGFVLEGNLTKTNENGGDYIYYAHA